MMQIPKTIGCKIVDLDKLFVSELNTRFQEQESETSEAFVWLCNSIKSEGLVEPLVVRPVAGGRFEIVAGTRRFAALKHIKAPYAPVVVKEMSDQDVRIASLIENIHRLDLTEDEKEYTMRQIYLTAWNEWVNPKDLKERPFDTDDAKLKLARSYLQRMHNEQTGGRGGVNYGKVYSSEKSKYAGSNTDQKVFPTEAFKKLSGRVGYAVSTQINILRGYGAFHVDKNFYEELPPTYKEIADRVAKEKKLLETEKQNMAKRMITARKVQRERVKHPKTQRQKAESAAKTFANKVERERNVKQRRMAEKQIAQQELDLVKSRKEQAKTREIERSSQQSEIVRTGIRSREDVSELGHKLFKVLTGQEVDGAGIEENEAIAKNTQAVQRMTEIATLYADGNDIAFQQHIVIPLCVALDKYRDILYDAVESRKRKDEMSRR